MRANKCLLREEDYYGLSSVVSCRSQADIDLKAAFLIAQICDLGRIT